MAGERYCNGCGRTVQPEQRNDCRRMICVARDEWKREQDYLQKRLWEVEREEERKRQARQQTDSWDSFGA
jgi:hypothetical protein